MVDSSLRSDEIIVAEEDSIVVVFCTGSVKDDVGNSSLGSDGVECVSLLEEGCVVVSVSVIGIVVDESNGTVSDAVVAVAVVACLSMVLLNAIEVE